MRKTLLTFLAITLGFSISAQDYFPKNDGVATTNTNFTAITNAKIYITPTEVIEKGTLIIKDGKVVSAGANVSIPKNATIIDATGKHIYPSFIDMYSNFGIDKPQRQGGGGRSAQYDATRTGYYWNDHVMPENNALNKLKYDSKKAEDLLKAGFVVVNTHIQDGIVRGTGTLVALNDNDYVLEQQSTQYLSLSKSALSNQSYPSSIMGSMALLRQFYLDADWYAKGMSKTKDLSIEALNKNKSLLQIFEAGSRANAMRADKVGDEFNIQYVLLGGGDEFERINDIKATNAAFIIPINFPDAYDVENAFLASSLSLSDMRAWNQKPTNPKVLADNNITFALTTHSLKSPKDFKSHLLNAIKHGLSKEKALEALTTVPAQLLGKSTTIGSLKNGAFANFMITSGDIFDEKTTIYQHWIQGNQNVFESMNTKDIRGDYEFSLAGEAYKMTSKGELSKLSTEITSDEKTRGSKISYKDDWATIAFTTKDSTSQDFIRIIANAKDNALTGKAID